jgi:hypothetical protein
VNLSGTDGGTGGRAFGSLERNVKSPSHLGLPPEEAARQTPDGTGHSRTTGVSRILTGAMMGYTWRESARGTGHPDGSRRFESGTQSPISAPKAWRMPIVPNNGVEQKAVPKPPNGHTLGVPASIGTRGLYELQIKTNRGFLGELPSSKGGITVNKSRSSPHRISRGVTGLVQSSGTSG